MFIVLEGSDGSGKTTQFKLLTERLKAAGYEVDTYDFPRYNEPSSYFVKQYLNGEFGPASEVSPYTASLFYALDRFEAAPLIRQSLADKKIVLANRYTGSNMAHQGAKFTSSAQQRGFFVWADSLEFQLLGVPRPSVNVFLRVPPEVSFELIKKKSARGYTTKKHDEHEADIEHLKNAVLAYDTLCQLFPKDYKAIDSTKNNKILPITEINNRIWKLIKPLLPKPQHPGRSAVVNLSEDTKPPAKSGSEIVGEKIELQDVSLLTLHSLIGRGLVAEYQINWPPEASKPRLTYYIPSEFPPKLAQKYRSTMDQLAKKSRRLNKKTAIPAKKYLTLLTPMAALVDAKINGERQSVNELLLQAAGGLAELRQITKDARAELREPLALKQIVKEMAESNLGANSATIDEPVKLLSATPRNELEVLADCLYPYSNLGRNEIAAEVDNWSYEQKAKSLKTLCLSDPTAVLKKLQYSFDVIADFPSIKGLLEKLTAVEVQIQPLTPRYGYSVPSQIEMSGDEEKFIEAFDKSLELFSEIQSAGFDHLAGYAVLSGHRQRWQISLSGEAIFNQIGQTPSNTLKLMKEQVAVVHPLVSTSIIEARSTSPQIAPKSSKQSANTPSRSQRKRRSKSKK